jgi:hypothetical protein
LNRGAKNKEFKDKKSQYLKNTGHLTELTKDLLTSPVWTQAAVVKRSNALAKEAADLWSWAALGRELKITAISRKTTVKRKSKTSAKKSAVKEKVQKKSATKKTTRRKKVIQKKATK